MNEPTEADMTCDPQKMLAGYLPKGQEHWALKALARRLIAKEAECNILRGAIEAQDQREKLAGDKCGVPWIESGCDWPDYVADAVLSERQRVDGWEKLALACSEATGAPHSARPVPTLIRRLRERADTAERQRNDLLARIFRDGGQTIDTFPTVEDACKEADKRCAEFIANSDAKEAAERAVAAMRSKIERLHGLVEGACFGWRGSQTRDDHPDHLNIHDTLRSADETRNAALATDAALAWAKGSAT